MSVQIRADVWPARVVRAGRDPMDPIKVLIGLDRLWLYKMSGRDGALVHEWPLDDIRGSHQHGWTAVVEGDEVAITRSGNCGCGTNKSWKPFDYQIVMSRIPKR